MTNYRWTICAMLFFATTVNYLDRQVLSLTWDEFIKPEFLSLIHISVRQLFVLRIRLSEYCLHDLSGKPAPDWVRQT